MAARVLEKEATDAAIKTIEGYLAKQAEKEAEQAALQGGGSALERAGTARPAEIPATEEPWILKKGKDLAKQAAGTALGGAAIDIATKEWDKTKKELKKHVTDEVGRIGDHFRNRLTENAYDRVSHLIHGHTGDARVTEQVSGTLVQPKKYPKEQSKVSKFAEKAIPYVTGAIGAVAGIEGGVPGVIAGGEMGYDAGKGIATIAHDLNRNRREEKGGGKIPDLPASSPITPPTIVAPPVSTPTTPPPTRPPSPPPSSRPPPMSPIAEGSAEPSSSVPYTPPPSTPLPPSTLPTPATPSFVSPSMRPNTVQASNYYAPQFAGSGPALSLGQPVPFHSNGFARRPSKGSARKSRSRKSTKKTRKRVSD